MNAFLHIRNTPYGSVPFNLIKISDYEEAVIEGIRIHDEEIKAIIENPDSPDFTNTIEAFEHSGRLLDDVACILFNMITSETNDELDKLSEKLSPVLTDHNNKILHNNDLFKKVDDVFNYYNKHTQQKEQLTAEQWTLLTHTHDLFIRCGAALNTEDKKKFASVSKELSLLEIKFEQNHLKDLNDFHLHITDQKQIPGLPDILLSTAAEEAVRRNVDGWVFTLHAPSYIPFLTYCSNRTLREKMYLAYNTICTHDNYNNNFEIVSAIVNKRRELAQLLGYSDYAEFVLEKRMAENKDNVYKLFDDLVNAYMPTAQKEVSDITKLATEENGDDFRLMPWDFSYYANRLKEKKFQINSEMVRPYLELNNVKEGVFQLAHDLYGLNFHLINNVPVYYPDVEVFEVTDEKGEFTALLYCDFFPRSSKKSGAWMTSFQEQYIDKDGKPIKPHVSINTNFTKPTKETPSLLTISELETFLHEFGHALHGILSHTHYKSLNGTNVYWDFVELPSQFMENYAIESSFLKKFAYHYKTGEELPENILKNIIQSRNFNIAYNCIRQVNLGLLDMSYYCLNNYFNNNIIDWEKNIFYRNRLLPYVEGTCMTVQFSHIMAGGYAAGYYSYKWAEVLDADAFALFKEKGIYNKETANRFKKEILSRGGTEHPMILYKRFRGKSPTINALLLRNGIK